MILFSPFFRPRRIYIRRSGEENGVFIKMRQSPDDVIGWKTKNCRGTRSCGRSGRPVTSMRRMRCTGRMGRGLRFSVLRVVTSGMRPVLLLLLFFSEIVYGNDQQRNGLIADEPQRAALIHLHRHIQSGVLHMDHIQNAGERDVIKDASPNGTGRRTQQTELDRREHLVNQHEQEQRGKPGRRIRVCVIQNQTREGNQKPARWNRKCRLRTRSQPKQRRCLRNSQP